MLESSSPHSLYGLQHASVGIILLDSRRCVISVSPDLDSMIGMPGNALVGKTLEDIHPQRNTARLHAVLDAAFHGENGSSTSVLIPMRAGHLLLLKVSYLPVVPNQNAGCYVLTVLDVLGSLPATAPKTASADAQLLKIPVETSQGVSLLDLNDVVYLKASGRYAEVKTRTGRPRLSNLSLKDMEGRLNPSQFLRVHRAFIINVAFAASFRRRGDACELEMSDEPASVIPIGRSRVVTVRTRLGL